MKLTVMCVVKNESQANEIVAQLQSSGFTKREISLLMPDRMRKTPDDFFNASRRPGTAGDGAAAIAELGVGTIEVAGFGTLIVSGPILQTLREASSPSKNHVVETLTAMGLPDVAAKSYEASVRGGRLLIAVSVETPEQQSFAERIYRSARGEEISATQDASVVPKSAYV